VSKARLARALLNLADYVGKDNGGGRIQLRLKIGQGDLAAMAGVARENVKPDHEASGAGRYRHAIIRLLLINDPKALAEEMEFGS